ncbi:MAG TPA: diguanylate cyclase [Kofleriaceae bacterium]|nr:diguanylate cyclase [Kofleriaceae bacterium]
MSRAKTRRPGTKSGRRAPTDFPDDLPSAAIAALDDLLTGGTERVEAPAPAAIEPDLPEPPPVARRAPPPPPAAKKSARAPARRPPSAPPAEEGLVVDETVLPEVPALRFAVFEDTAHVTTAQHAIASVGHTIAIAETGADGSQRVIDAIRRGAIDAVLVGLPSSPGPATAIVDAALALEPRRPVVIAAAAGDAATATKRAIAAGADLVTMRPHDVGRIAPIALAAARLQLERAAVMSARGSEQVLRARLDEIADGDPRGLQPMEVFQRVLELEIRRARRYEYPLSVALFAVEIAPPPPPPGIRGILRARAGNALIHTIRDIDLATQLDHERFLVLLPYTDLAGAAGLGRRVISAVGALEPVVSAGRSFPPRVVGAVAGGSPGAAQSFAKLMKDATRALEQARRDGAELAVQP